MLRHCYSICLFLATLGAVLVCLRPQWGVQWLAQIETWAQKAQAAAPSDGLSPPKSSASSSPLHDDPSPPPNKSTSNSSSNVQPSSSPLQPSSQDLNDSEQIRPGESIPYQPPEPSGSASSAPSSHSEGAPRPSEAFFENPSAQRNLPQDLGRLPQRDFQESSTPEPPRWWNESASSADFRGPPPETSPSHESSRPKPEEGENQAPWQRISSLGPQIPAHRSVERSENFERPIRTTPQSSSLEGAPIGGDIQDELPTEREPCEGARVVARVATDVVLMSDIWVSAEQFLISLYFRQKAQLPQVPPPPPLEGILAQRDAFVQAQWANLIRQLVDAKLAYYDALTVVPQESLKNMEEQVARHFEKVELPKFLSFYQVQTYPELDERLRQGGTSLARHRRLYFERTLASQWLAQKVKVNEEVGYEEMWRWYQEHLADFEQPAQVRWEQISVRISKYPSREAAWAALAHAGNQLLDGRPFADVARQFSDAPNASEGGLRDWTTLGSLRSEILNQALVQLPVGALSPILEDGDWLHIVRVIQRQEARRIPFVEAQVKIREEIRKQRTQIQHQAYLDQLRRRVPVWTVLDQRPARSRTAAIPRPEY